MTFSLTPHESALYADFSFVHKGQLAKNFPRCGITLHKAGSMRFRNGANKALRSSVFSKIGLEPENMVGIELIHSKIVYAVSAPQDVLGKQGDGFISITKNLSLSITAADCMPLYLYDPVTGCFGMLHSGWKGTGIITEALNLAKTEYGSKPEDFSVIIGPHINDCCYEIEADRREYFASEFTPECITERVNEVSGKTQLFLSLAQANLHLLKKAGVKEENIAICTDCTSCTPCLSSFRVHSAQFDSSVPLEERVKSLSVMAAYIAG